MVAAYRLPKASDDEKATRKAEIQAAMKKAAETPLETMRHASEALGMAPPIARLGNANAASDVVVAVELLLAAARGARANVEINLESLDDAAYVAQLREEVAGIDRQCASVASGFSRSHGLPAKAGSHQSSAVRPEAGRRRSTGARAIPRQRP